ncbi:Hsp20/alpha crystallin family protein [Pleomorphovibrio marinus]|uniref:Hsp20/alpha crystallin family protein n=1 Tax=Pleomorphovibrio marinus TaxID=2164132 RepID=UPI000E0AA176|nr:Hsp20/alpha crystallin family protein [Pleomorphovibrio marinus]
MTLLKVKNNGKSTEVPTFENWFDRLFEWPENFEGRKPVSRYGNSMPAVNIKEDDRAYHVELAAPGFKKEDFKINFENEQLTISSERKEEQAQEERITRREFSYHSFTRSFYIPEDKVDIDGIAARYSDGILHVTLPKKENNHNQVRQIEIS